jgi:hypothetical protein
MQRRCSRGSCRLLKNILTCDQTSVSFGIMIVIRGQPVLSSSYRVGSLSCLESTEAGDALSVSPGIPSSSGGRPMFNVAIKYAARSFTGIYHIKLYAPTVFTILLVCIGAYGMRTWYFYHRVVRGI